MYGADGSGALLYRRRSAVSLSWKCDSMPHWRRTMQGACGRQYRAGDRGEPDRTGGSDAPRRKRRAEFLSAVYGSSFITDEVGEITAQASRDREEILVSEIDLKQAADCRLEWGLYRDRRPHCYDTIRSLSAAAAPSEEEPSTLTGIPVTSR